MLLNNAQVCLNMPETEPKITVQAKQRLQIHMCIQNFAKHLKWFQEERPANIIIVWNFFQKFYNISDRDLNTVELRIFQASQYATLFQVLATLNNPPFPRISFLRFILYVMLLHFRKDKHFSFRLTRKSNQKFCQIIEAATGGGL